MLIAGAANDNVTPAILSGNADDVTGNLLKPTLTATTVGTTEGANYGKVFVLGNKNSTPGFYKSNNGRVLTVGKAYLYLESGVSAAREFYAFDFDNETTSISAALKGNEEMINDNVVFDLQGRQVAQPLRSATNGDASTVGLKKGLYIVNGKKVIVK